jgi:hypothetical protein
LPGGSSYAPGGGNPAISHGRYGGPGKADCAGAGLVGYWEFDEGDGKTTLDSSGNGNNGMRINDPKWVIGQEGGCFNFRRD